MATTVEDVRRKKRRGLVFYLIFAAFGWGLYVLVLTSQILQNR